MLNEDHYKTSFDNIKNMLSTRNINITSIENNFEDSDFIVKTINNDIIVLYNKQDSFLISTVRSIKKYINTEKKLVLLICITEPNIKQQKLIELQDDDKLIKINIEYHTLDSTIINPINCKLQPVFEVLNDDDIYMIIEKYQLKSKYKLPIINIKDPIAKYFGLKKGDVIKCIRQYKDDNGNKIISNNTNGNFYRVCL
jgi:DNA-directed RNA polymerase subunit H (RpoH/RPB5)